MSNRLEYLFWLFLFGLFLFFSSVFFWLSLLFSRFFYNLSDRLSPLLMSYHLNSEIIGLFLFLQSYNLDFRRRSNLLCRKVLNPQIIILLFLFLFRFVIKFYRFLMPIVELGLILRKYSYIFIISFSLFSKHIILYFHIYVILLFCYFFYYKNNHYQNKRYPTPFFRLQFRLRLPF